MYLKQKKGHPTMSPVLSAKKFFVFSFSPTGLLYSVQYSGTVQLQIYCLSKEIEGVRAVFREGGGGRVAQLGKNLPPPSLFPSPIFILFSSPFFFGRSCSPLPSDKAPRRSCFPLPSDKAPGRSCFPLPSAPLLLQSHKSYISSINKNYLTIEESIPLNFSIEIKFSPSLVINNSPHTTQSIMSTQRKRKGKAKERPLYMIFIKSGKQEDK